MILIVITRRSRPGGTWTPVSPAGTPPRRRRWCSWGPGGRGAGCRRSCGKV